MKKSNSVCRKAKRNFAKALVAGALVGVAVIAGAKR